MKKWKFIGIVIVIISTIMEITLELMISDYPLIIEDERLKIMIVIIKIFFLLVIVLFCFYIMLDFRYEKEINDMLNKYEKIIDIINTEQTASYFICDRKSLICRYVSPNIINIFGVSAYKLINLSFKEILVNLINGNLNPELMIFIENNFKNEESNTERFLYKINEDCSEKYLKFKKYCFEKEIIFYIIDESNQKNKDQVLKKAVLTAEDANKSKSSFFSGISHDIRTPLNAIIGCSSLLKKYSYDEKKVCEYADKMNNAGKFLLDLISDVLDMGRIENGKFDLKYEKFNIRELVDESISMLLLQIEYKKQKFIVKMDDLKNEVFLSDKIKISQAIINLVSNAIKYTPKNGKIELVISSNGEIRGKDRIFIEVIDNGKGMNKALVENIFEPYIRGKRINGIQGSGLGMAITKNIVDLLGGEISVESEEGKGSKFKIELNLKVSNDNEFYEKNRENNISGMKFLIAEDNKINAEIINELLKIEGAECDIVENGEEIVKKFLNSTNEDYDIILMDIRMPIMNGYDATKIIRSSNHERAKTIPIIAMTANSFIEDVEEALESGMNSHLSKPINMDLFKKTISKFK